MASGQTHAACTLALSALSFGAIQGTLADPLIASACALGCLSGVFITPDLDQQTRSMSESLLIRRTFGLGYLWLLLWFPYAKLIKHRSPLSHFPVLGTAGRLFYMALWLAIPAYFGIRLTAPSPEIWPLLGWGALGLALSDFGHWIFDLKWGF